LLRTGASWQRARAARRISSPATTNHAAPFSRERLVDLWQRCTEDPSQRDACLAAREQLGETLAELEIPD
jgi:hypothetical protein